MISRYHLLVVSILLMPSVSKSAVDSDYVSLRIASYVYEGENAEGLVLNDSVLRIDQGMKHCSKVSNISDSETFYIGEPAVGLNARNEFTTFYYHLDSGKDIFLNGGGVSYSSEPILYNAKYSEADSYGVKVVTIEPGHHIEFCRFLEFDEGLEKAFSVTRFEPIFFNNEKGYWAVDYDDKRRVISNIVIFGLDS